MGNEVKLSLHVSLLQTDITWENPVKNLDRFSKIIGTLKNKSDLIVLPEMFNTGFTMNVKQYTEQMDGRTVDWMRQVAEQSKADVAGSLIIREGNSVFNRLVWVKPEGGVYHYDKRHLFRMAGEGESFSDGTERIIVEIQGWKVLPLVCYDLRFPVWARNNKNEYDLIIYAANWPERRIAHWDLLLQARAVENQCYVAAVNRIGKDGQGNNHTGNSAIYDFMGKQLTEISHSESIISSQLSYSTLTTYREKFPVWQDADSFQIV